MTSIILQLYFSYLHGCLIYSLKKMAEYSKLLTLSLAGFSPSNILFVQKRGTSSIPQTQWFLRGSAIPAYVHASKLTGLEDFTKQASKASNAYNWLTRCQLTFTTRYYPQSLNPSISQHLQSLNLILQKGLQMNFSHTMCLITNESSMCEWIRWIQGFKAQWKLYA